MTGQARTIGRSTAIRGGDALTSTEKKKGEKQMKEMDLESSVVAKASFSGEVGGKFEVLASYDGKNYRATSRRSSGAALSTATRKLLKAFPKVTHVEVDGHLLPVGA